MARRPALVQADFATAMLLPPVIGRSGTGDAIEPAEEAFSPELVRGQAFQHAHKDLGSKILGDGFVPDTGQDIAIDRLDVQAVQLGNRLLIALSGPFNEESLML